MLACVRRVCTSSPRGGFLNYQTSLVRVSCNQRRAPASVLNVLLLVYVIAVNVPSWLGNTPHTRDSLLPRLSVSMLTSFALNAGGAELRPVAPLCFDGIYCSLQMNICQHCECARGKKNRLPAVLFCKIKNYFCRVIGSTYSE